LLMTWEDKRELLKRVFAGRYEDGKRAAVYIEWAGPSQRVRYMIRGLLTLTDRLSTDGKLPKIDPEGLLAERQGDVVTKSLWHYRGQVPPVLRILRPPSAPPA
jgi:hypothetical protein